MYTKFQVSIVWFKAGDVAETHTYTNTHTDKYGSKYKKPQTPVSQESIKFEHFF